MATGFFERIRALFRVHTNRAISRYETPDVLAEQAVMASKSNRDQVYQQLVKSKAAEVETRQRARQAIEEAQVYRERAKNYLQQGNRAGAELVMSEALQREDMAKKLSADCEQAQRVNAELSLSLARLDAEIADIKMQSVITTSRYRQAEAIKGVSVARYGDPDHPRRGAREMLQTANEGTMRLASTGQAIWEIGQSLPNTEFGPDDMADRVAAELDTLSRGSSGELSAQNAQVDNNTADPQIGN